MGIAARRFIQELGRVLEKECGSSIPFQQGLEDPTFVQVFRCPFGTINNIDEARDLINRVANRLGDFGLDTGYRGLALDLRESTHVTRVGGVKTSIPTLDLKVGPASYFDEDLGDPPRGDVYKVLVRAIQKGGALSTVTEWTLPAVGGFTFNMPEKEELRTWASRRGSRSPLVTMIVPSWDDTADEDAQHDSWYYPMVTGVLYPFDASLSGELATIVKRLGGTISYPEAGDGTYLGMMPWRNYLIPGGVELGSDGEERRRWVPLRPPPAEVVFTQPDGRDRDLGALIFEGPGVLYLFVNDPLIEPSAVLGDVDYRGMSPQTFQSLFGGPMNGQEPRKYFPTGLAVASLAALGLLGLGMAAGIAGTFMMKKKR